MSKMIHLNKVGLNKLTLLRWLEAKESLPGGKKAWKPQRELIDRRTRSYTVEEIRGLLELGRGEYQARRGANKLAVSRLSDHLTNVRNTLVTTTEKKLAKLSK